MKVLYIAHYREGSGWAQAAIDYILALDAAGVDVVPRSVKLNQANPELPERILELEQKSTEGSTHCIQHILPHFMDYNSCFKKNVGLFVTETDSIFWTGWPQRLKLMDQVWIPNEEMLDVCYNAGIEDYYCVPHASNIDKFDRFERIEPLELDPSLLDRTLFYFIGENNRRKRISGLLQAYYKAFDRNDDVALIIKTNGHPDSLEEMAGQIRKQMRMYSGDHLYPPVQFITERLPEKQLLGLHARCDAFVTATFGDAWSIPAFDAMLAGNWVISTDCGGMADFLPAYEKGLLIPATKVPVIGADPLFQDVQTGHENWWSVDLLEMSECMRTLHENIGKSDKVPNRKHLEKYDYLSVGNLMKDLLNDS